ncbi:MAG: hypothetical protein BGO98_28585 [Myxococcales bacterium 68-20]|nr:MAG: hypothetical protein BGO98_28585 [Myxococcales bacterium 68-20]
MSSKVASGLARHSSTTTVAPNLRSTTGAEGIAMSKIVRHPDDAILEELPTTRIPSAARRQVIAMRDGKGSPDELPTTRIPDSERRQVIAMVAAKRPSLAPSVVLRKPIAVLDSGHLEDASDSASGLRAAPERTEAPGPPIPERTESSRSVPAVTDAPRPSEAPIPERTESSRNVPAVTDAPRPSEAPIPERTEPSRNVPAVTDAPRPSEARIPERTEPSRSVPAVTDAPRPSDAPMQPPAPEPSLRSALVSAEVCLDLEDASDSGSGLRPAPGRSESSRNVLAVFDAPRPSEAPMQPSAPDPSVRPVLGHTSLDVLGHTSPDVLLQAIPDRSGRRLAFIICFLALCSVGVLTMAAKSSPSSSHHPGVQARDHGVRAVD